MLRDREHVTVYVDFLIVSNYSAYISCRRRIATGNDVTTKLCRANALNKIYSYQPNWTKVNYSSDIVLQIINSNCWLFSASDFINVIIMKLYSALNDREQRNAELHTRQR